MSCFYYFFIFHMCTLNFYLLFHSPNLQSHCLLYPVFWYFFDVFVLCSFILCEKRPVTKSRAHTILSALQSLCTKSCVLFRCIWVKQITFQSRYWFEQHNNGYNLFDIVTHLFALNAILTRIASKKRNDKQNKDEKCLPVSDFPCNLPMLALLHHRTRVITAIKQKKSIRHDTMHTKHLPNVIRTIEHQHRVFCERSYRFFGSFVPQSFSDISPFILCVFDLWRSCHLLLVTPQSLSFSLFLSLSLSVSLSLSLSCQMILYTVRHQIQRFCRIRPQRIKAHMKKTRLSAQ